MEDRKSVDVNNSVLYEALGVSQGANYSEIKRAFHRKAKIMSPDRHLNHPEWKAVNEKFAYLVFAHNILKSSSTREAYDSNGFEGLRRLGVAIPAGFANFRDPLPDQREEDDKAKLERVKAKLIREMKLLEDYWAKRMAERLRLQEETREAYRIATYKQIIQIAWKKEILNERRNFLSRHTHDLRK